MSGPPVITAHRVSEDDLGSRPWRGAAIASVVLFGIASLFILIGLPLKVVLDVEHTQLFGVSIKYQVTYYDASASFNGDSAKVDMDDVTCGRAGAVKFGGALHYFALFTSLATFVCLGMEIRTGKNMKHGSVSLMCSSIALLFGQDVMLGIVRSHANYSNCNTVPFGLIRYGIGPCWGMCIGGMIIEVIALTIYISSRYCKCCCYDPTFVEQRPGQQQHQQHYHVGTTTVVMQGQAMPAQPQQAMYTATPVNAPPAPGMAMAPQPGTSAPTTPQAPQYDPGVYGNNNQYTEKQQPAEYNTV